MTLSTGEPIRGSRVFNTYVSATQYQSSSTETTWYFLLLALTRCAAVGTVAQILHDVFAWWSTHGSQIAKARY